jgi:hypothetical protein
MTQQRLKSLAVSHIHQEVLDLVDVDALIEESVSMNEKNVRQCLGNDSTHTIISCAWLCQH